MKRLLTVILTGIACAVSGQSLTITTNETAPKLLVGATANKAYIDVFTNMTRNIQLYTSSSEVPIVLDFRYILDDMKVAGSITNFWQYDQETGRTIITQAFRDYYAKLVSLFGQTYETPVTVNGLADELTTINNVWTNPYTGETRARTLYSMNHDNLIRFYRMHVTYRVIGGDDLYLLDVPQPIGEEELGKYNALILQFGNRFEPALGVNAGTTGPFTNFNNIPVWLLDREFWIKKKLMESWK